MYKEQYQKTYIKCYEKIVDIVELVKNFLYPGKYCFQRLNDTMSIDEKIEYIRNDLESVGFTSEVDYSLIEVLEYFFPLEAKIYDKESWAELEENGLNKVSNLYEKLKDKYIPFIKFMAVNDYSNKNDEERNDEEVWKTSLMSNLSTYEDKIEEIIWTIMDSKNEELIDKILQEEYYLDEIEFNRYMSGKDNPNSSIKRSDDGDFIDCDFAEFKKHFRDIYGQDKALNTIEKVLKRNIFLYNAEDVKKVKRKKTPLSTFMFYGPTGTGKTECAKRIADFIYGEERKILILDMNSYKDGKIGSSAIKGHPEGYVNSEKGTAFTRFLKANSGGVIVLDEFEKADPEVREIFMTMLDEGEFRDALGNVYDLSAYVFIATTNASEKFESKKKNSIGFNSSNKEDIKQKEMDIKEGLREIFTAPIMNRFNNLVHFKKIEYEDAMDICMSLIKAMRDTFEGKRFNGKTPTITINNIEEIAYIILKECNYEKDGVRTLKNVVNDVIGSSIIEEILNNNTNIVVDCKNDKIVVKNQIIAKL